MRKRRISKYWKDFFRIQKQLDQIYRPRPKRRKSFSKYVKMATLMNQGQMCVDCNILLDVVDFHHIDGNKENNHVSNCEALCPTCHARRTRKKRFS